MDASQLEHTNRTGDLTNDPLDQGLDKVSNTLDGRKEKSVGQIKGGLDLNASGAMNGNIYNVTNTINVHVG